MTRLIDADALYKFFLEMHKSGNACDPQDVLKAITNAPTVQREGLPIDFLSEEEKDGLMFQKNKHAPMTTVQREGWVSVDDLQRLYDDMFRHKDIAISANSLFKLINHE